MTASVYGAYACLAASMALVGSYVGLSKLLVAVLPVFLLAWLRFGIAALAMATWLKRSPGEAPLSTHERWLLFWESFLGNFLFSICMLLGVAATSAVAAGVVMAGIPAAVALLSWWWLGERIAPRVAAGIVCAVLGMVLLAWVRHSPQGVALAGAAADAASTTPSGWGLLLLVGAVLCEASYVVIGKKLSAKVSPKRISALINLWGLVLMTPLGLWQARSFAFESVAPVAWLGLVFYALAASVVTVWLWMRGLQRVPAPQAGVFTVLLPLSATAVGVLALGEAFSAAHGMALALSLAGLLLATWPGRNSQKA